VTPNPKFGKGIISSPSFPSFSPICIVGVEMEYPKSGRGNFPLFTCLKEQGISTKGISEINYSLCGD
jgi:hypothetical protein